MTVANIGELVKNISEQGRKEYAHIPWNIRHCARCSFFCLRRSTGSTASRCASAAPIRQISTAPPADTGRGACDVLALAMREAIEEGLHRPPLRHPPSGETHHPVPDVLPTLNANAISDLTLPPYTKTVKRKI